MKPDLTPVKPAFRRQLHAQLWIVIVFVILLAPVAMRGGFVSKSALYSAVPASMCDARWLYNQTNELKSDVDVAFVGASTMWCAIDATTVQNEISAICGNDKNVALLGHFFWGEDLDYFLLRDLLSKRRVHLVVLQLPVNYWAPWSWTHPAAPNWITFDDWCKLSTAPLSVRLCLYSELIFSTPRKLLSSLRIDLPGQLKNCCEEHMGSFYGKLSRAEKDYAAIQPTIAQDLDEPTLYSKSPQSFLCEGKVMCAYRKFFLDQTTQLLQEHGVRMLFLHIPTKGDYRKNSNQKLVERFYTPGDFGKMPDILGVRPFGFFADLGELQVESLFRDDAHLNVNGAKYFSRLISPGIVQVYEQSPRSSSKL